MNSKIESLANDAKYIIDITGGLHVGLNSNPKNAFDFWFDLYS